MSAHFVYSPETIIKAYSLGVFPMAESRDDPELHFYEPDQRGVIPLHPPHIPKRLLRHMRSCGWQFSFNQDFAQIIRSCAELRAQNTWINAEIERLCLALHKMGFAHSVEVRCDGEIIGGLYGISLGGMFFGESMFSLRPNASKSALAYLMASLNLAGYRLLDAQFASEHLRQFGLVEISKTTFQSRLAEALSHKCQLPLSTPQHQILDHALQLRRVTS